MLTLLVCFLVVVMCVVLGIRAMDLSAKAGENRLVIAAQIDGNGTPTPPSEMFQTTARTGGPGGKPCQIILGRNFLFAHNDNLGPDELAVYSYDDIFSVEIEEPDLPYIMNLNLAGVLANEMTRKQSGLNVIVCYETPHRVEQLVFGGMSLKNAFELRDRLDDAIITGTHVLRD